MMAYRLRHELAQHLAHLFDRKKMKLEAGAFLLVIAISCCLFNIPTFAQPKRSATMDSSAMNSPGVKSDDDGEREPQEPSPSGSSGGEISIGGRMSSFEFDLSLIILGFGFLVLVGEYLLLRRISCTPEQLLRIFGITLIVIGAMLMVPAGFNAQAIAPAMGLLGTIAGYLLSQRAKTTQGDNSKEHIET